MLRRVIPLLLLCTASLAVQAQGLRLRPEGEALQARLNLVSSDEFGGSRLVGAQLLGDYYLIGQGSGLRLSGGLVLGPQSLLGSGMAPAKPGLLGVGHRRLLGRSEENSQSQTYLGVGFSRYGSAWGFTADLGVAVAGSASGIRLGGTSAFASSVDETLRRLQWTPMLQLGLNYRF